MDGKASLPAKARPCAPRAPPPPNSMPPRLLCRPPPPPPPPLKDAVDFAKYFADGETDIDFKKFILYHKHIKGIWYLGWFPQDKIIIRS